MLLSTSFWVWEWLGRLHPMIVHFPIGLLIAALGFEILTWRGKRKHLREATSILLLAGLLSAVCASTLGLILHEQESYPTDLVERHEWLGVLTTLFAGLSYFLLRKRPQKPTAFRLSLIVTVILLTVAGHLGANLTHGADYLNSVLPGNRTEAAPDHSDELLAEFASDGPQKPLAPEQLDRLNLEVRAIFAHACYRCHSSDKRKGGLALDGKKAVFAGGDSGPVVLQGEASQSDLFRRINLPRSDEDAMPSKGDLLSSAQIDLIQLWIDQGAHWADEALQVFPEAELALEMPVLPNSTEVHPIDKLVDAYFQEQGQKWPEPVSDRLFLRRVYLDVIGLLPSPAQAEAFVADTDPGKRNKIIDELLTNKNSYAQHWLSFWNDLLRNDYSGPGFITGGRRRITDWLYESLQTNRSYNQMVRQLLNPTPETEGFVKGISWRGDINASQRTEMQAAQNVAQVFLGLNLKCASCHNSFVSNLKLEEAYALANVFADTTLEIHRCDKPTGRMAESAFLYPELGTIDGPTVKARLEQLATVMVQPENGRLYRTLVNRIWDRLLGRGIVMPVDEMDQQPWNATLLDWLAADFREHEGDIQHLLRQILTSRTYQLPSVAYTSTFELGGKGYVFRGPLKRRLTAEQFADAVSQTLSPLYHSVAFDPLGGEMPAQWIWFREMEVERDVLPKPGKRYFRHDFELPLFSDAVEAELLASADHSFRLWLNGKLVAEGANWQAVQRVDVSTWLKSGKNVISVSGENEGSLPNPAGLLVSLQVREGGKEIAQIVTNQDWKARKTEPEQGWQSGELVSEDWEKARRYGNFFNKNWGALVEFHHGSDSLRLSLARASLVQLDPFLKALGRPTRENITTQRADEATLLQALSLTNGAFLDQVLAQSAEQWIDRHADQADVLVQQLYQQLLQRAPAPKEQQLARKHLSTEPEVAAVQDLMWAMILLPEFQWVQ